MEYERLSVAQTAERLGITVDGVRKRMQRRAFTAEKDERGRWTILLPVGYSENKPKQKIVSDGEDVHSEEHSEVSTSQLLIEVEHLKAQLDQAVKERDDWHKQAVDTIQVLKNQQVLALPDAMKLIASASPQPSILDKIRGLFKRSEH